MRKIFSLMFAAVLSISTAFATTVYCKMTQSWWTTGSAAIAVHYWGNSAPTTWPGVRMAAVAGQEGTWSYDVPADVTDLMFVRVNGSGDVADWGAKTANLTLPTDGKNLYTITSAAAVWGDPGVVGEWSTYSAGGGETPDPDPDPDPETPVDSMTVYFVNSLSWDLVNTFVWPAEGASYKAWPGEAAKKEAEKINGYDVYAYTFPASYVNVIFNNGTVQTVDLTWAAAKPYFVPGAKDGEKYTGTWYAKADIPTGGETPDPETPVDSMTVYFVNSLSWDLVNTFVWPAEGASYKAWPGEAAKKEAEKINGYDVYAYTFPASYANVIFNNGTVQTTDLEWVASKPYFVPGAKVGEKYTGIWYAKADIPAPGAPVDSTTVYYVNTEDWTKVQAFVWLEGTGSYKDWPGEAMTKTANKALEKDIYSYTFPSVYTSIIFNNKTGDEGNQTKDLVWSKEKPYYCDGEWFASIEDIKPVVAAKFYVTGDSALIIDAGLPIAKTWASDAIKSESDTCVLTLKANQDYQLSLTVDGTWTTKKTYADLTKEIPGLNDVDGDNHNIGFKLNTAGDVKVVYFVKDEQLTFELLGDFNVAPAPEPVDSMTVYMVNNLNWLTVNTFVWQGENVYKAWPGEAAKKEVEKINGYDVYAYTFPASFAKVIFSTDIAQTADLEWVASKPYFVPGEVVENKFTGTWYAKADIPAVEPEAPAKYYLAGTMNEWKVGANEFVGENDTLRLSIALEADSVYKYKVVKVVDTDTTWLGTGYEVTMEYGNSTDWHLDGEENAGLHTTKAANYDFIFVPKANNRIDVIIPAPEYVYSVAGSEGLLGSNWNEKEGNEMVKQEDGTYKLVLENVELAKGSYAFKVVINHKWNNGEAEDNSELVIEKSGKYDVTFTYDPVEPKTEVKAVLKEEIVVIPTVKIAGDWDWENPLELALDESKLFASIKMTLAKGPHPFKMIVGGNWLGNGYEINRDFVGFAGLNTNTDDMVIAADTKGDYIITWTFANDSISVTFPEKSLEPDRLSEGYYLIGLNGWTVDDIALTDKFTVNPEDENEYFLADVTLAVGNSFKAVYVKNDGILSWIPDGEGNDYVVDENHAGTKTIYFRPAGSEAWGGCFYVAPNELTAIDNAATDAKAVKMIKNGMLVIIKSGKLYNVMGIQIQ